MKNGIFQGHWRKFKIDAIYLYVWQDKNDLSCILIFSSLWRVKMLSEMYKTLEELEQAVYKVSWTGNWWYIYGTICRLPF